MELNETLDNGETYVQIASIGKVIGSDNEGNSVEQNFTEESLKKIADDLNLENKEILVDKDHSSMRKGLDRDSTACGWASEFEVKEGKGLFGKIKWSDIGHAFIHNRVFRWLSPVFRLNKATKEPIEMLNIALTNMPSQNGIDPIVNSAPNEIVDEKEDLTDSKTEDIEMTKEEIVDLIKSTIAEMKAAEKVEEVKEEIKEEIVDNGCVKNEEVVEELKEDKKVEEPVVENETTEEKVEEKKEEIIKIEALNSAPVPELNSSEKWKTLSGKAFRDFIESGKWRQ